MRAALSQPGGERPSPRPGSGRRNRVQPDGELVAVPDRGTLWGNRGQLLDADGVLTRYAPATGPGSAAGWSSVVGDGPSGGQDD